MKRMRVLFVVLVLGAIAIAPSAFAIDGCWKCQMTIHADGTVDGPSCEYPGNREWGWDDCDVTYSGDRVECETSGWACYYIEVTK